MRGLGATFIVPMELLIEDNSVSVSLGRISI